MYSTAQIAVRVSRHNLDDLLARCDKTPTTIENVGDSAGSEHLWIFRIRVDEPRDTSALVTDLLESLGSTATQQLEEFAAEHAAEVEVTCVMHYLRDPPGVWLEPNQVDALARLGAGFDVDLYDEG